MYILFNTSQENIEERSRGWRDRLKLGTRVVLLFTRSSVLVTLQGLIHYDTILTLTLMAKFLKFPLLSQSPHLQPSNPHPLKFPFAREIPDTSEQTGVSSTPCRSSIADAMMNSVFIRVLTSKWLLHLLSFLYPRNCFVPANELLES